MHWYAYKKSLICIYYIMLRFISVFLMYIYIYIYIIYIIYITAENCEFRKLLFKYMDLSILYDLIHCVCRFIVVEFNAYLDS